MFSLIFFSSLICKCVVGFSVLLPSRAEFSLDFSFFLFVSFRLPDAPHVKIRIGSVFACCFFFCFLLLFFISILSYISSLNLYRPEILHPAFQSALFTLSTSFYSIFYCHYHIHTYKIEKLLSQFHYRLKKKSKPRDKFVRRFIYAYFFRNCCSLEIDDRKALLFKVQSPCDSAFWKIPFVVIVRTTLKLHHLSVVN